MDVSPTSSQTPTAAISSASAAPLSSDFEDFIQLLTAQAKYQDPLEPIDSTEYVGQLAQFSMVEQQVLTNELMGLQYELAATSTMASLSGWVGMEARAAAPMQFDGSSPITISPNPASISDDVKLVVRNEAGEEVDRISLPVSAEPYDWYGIDPVTGLPMEEGVYSFQIESYANGELILAETAEVYGQVTEAQSIGGEIILIMEGGSAVPSTSVTAIRDPAAF